MQRIDGIYCALVTLVPKYSFAATIKVILQFQNGVLLLD